MQEAKKRHSNPFRVGLLATSVEFGGLEAVVKKLIDHLDQERFDITPLIFTANRQKDRTLVSKLKESGIKYHDIIVDGERIKYMNPMKNLKQVYNLIKDHQFDLVHTHGYRADVLGFMAASPLRVPLIATCHGFIPNDKKLIFYNSIDKFVLKSFKRVIAVSNDIAATLIEDGVKEENISVIPNAVNLNHDERSIKQCRRMKRELMEWHDNYFVLGYVGRLSEEKGLRFLIAAASDLITAGIPVRLAIIGEGSERNDLEFMTRQHGIETVVKFLGFQKDIHSWLPAFDAFILPSLMEGTPMAMLEAMLCGIPVVASSVGGIPDVIKSGENGLLVRAGNTIEISEAVRILYRNQELRSIMGIKARETIQTKYNVKDWITKIEEEYLRVVSG